MVAPAFPAPGFVLATALGFWLAAFFSDWSAFRLRAPMEAVLPSASLFIFASVLGSESDRLRHVAMFIAAALAFLLLYRVAVHTMGPGWVRGDARRGATAMVGLGAKLVALAVAIALLAGPLLPGASEPAVLAWRDVGSGGGARTVVSPLVDLGKRLVEQSDVEFFTVRSDARTYWRMTALDRWDGDLWGYSGRYGKAAGELPREPGPRAADSTVVIQEYELGPVGHIWVPAAFEAVRVEPGDTAMRWDAESSTLIVEADRADNISYTVESLLSLPDDSVLAAPANEIPAEIAEHYLQLPEQLDPRVAELARSVTASAPTPGMKARALQDYLRANYTYSLELERLSEGHDRDVIANFLFGESGSGRAGFCVHFAGSFAAMARSIGLPTRLGYGFTYGTSSVDDPTLYRVSGKYLHTWPEVYLADHGWVPFEPTPGRGLAGAESYTGVSENQEGGTAPQATTTSTTAPESDADVAAPEFDVDIPEDVAPGGAVNGNSSGAGVSRMVLIALAVLVLGLGYLLGMPAIRRVLRQRRRSAANSPNERIDVAWQEATEALELVGVRPVASETYYEYADRVDRTVQIDGAPHRQLADDAVTARYSGADVAGEIADRAESNAGQIQRHVEGQLGWTDRLRRELRPGDLVRAGLERFRAQR